MWHMVGGGLTFSQNFSSLALTVWDRQCLEDSQQKDPKILLIDTMKTGSKCPRAILYHIYCKEI